MPGTGLSSWDRDSTIYIINAAKYMNSAVSYSNTSCYICLPSMGLSNKLQGPLEFLSKVPMNCFHGCVLLKGIAAQFSACKNVMWAYRAEFSFPPHAIGWGKRYWNVEKYIPIPDCFFPPNGTLLFNILYWFTHTCGIENRSIGTDETRSRVNMFATHGASFQRRWNTHALIGVILQLNEMRSEKDRRMRKRTWMKSSPKTVSCVVG